VHPVAVLNSSKEGNYCIMFHRSRRLFTAVSIIAAASSMTFSATNAEPRADAAVADESPQIIGGSWVSTKTYPWVVKLVGADCGGALIAPTKVLTAGHCAGQPRLSRGGTKVLAQVAGSSA
jgi:secreted trypsin-like serine protease